MNESLDLLHVADANQARASDPEACAWVSANAGTGKTAVLVKRALRLLLAEAQPEGILCLTYTKTTAAEMQNRLLAELAKWATAPKPDLREALTALLQRGPKARELRLARRLFARALEARGGLKIHTIHGFCERLLQRFPLEAQVTPHFSVLDEREAANLRRAAFDRVVAQATEEKDGSLSKPLTRIVTATGEDYFRQAVDAVLAKRAQLAALVALHEGERDWVEAECAALKRRFGVNRDETEAHLVAELAAVLSDAEIDTVVAAYERHADGLTSDDRRLLDQMRTARRYQGEARVAALAAAFLTEGKPRQRVCGVAFQRADAALCARLEAARDRFAALNEQLAHLICAEASGALLALADAIIGEYEHAKRAEAALDYDDLILKTWNLLSLPAAAAWVLFKIDGGVEHILVDEAQDTNPLQWSVIERLAEEFFASQGASDRRRTLFAVGDEKQSIYSFQGADPSRFAAMGRSFARKAQAAGLPWHHVPLTLSFRSTAPILAAVDEVFARPPAAQGLVFDDGTGAPAILRHYVYRQGQAGLVEIWDSVTQTKADGAAAFEPWEEAETGARSVEEVCGRIARLVDDWLKRKEMLVSQGRPVRPGDILILVRRREPFTAPMIRALKRLRIPVAGADRMRLKDQIAVEDLITLAQVLLLPEDDFSLACLLKSPLFGLDDQALFDLGYGRQGSLFGALNEKAGEPRFAEAARQLSEWLSRHGTLPPFEFFSEVLSADDQLMRKRMLTRLGPEAAEAIDEFMERALAYDREAAPSLQGFIQKVANENIEIVRDMEQARDEVRIMTVHGAKGLEAPIVFLPDTCMTPRPQGPCLYGLPRRGAAPDEAGHLVWAPGGAKLDALKDAKEEVRRAELEEYHRLLYVAMTRARDRLYVCGFAGQQHDDGSWYELVREGLKGLVAEVKRGDEKPAQRMECAQTAETPAQSFGPDRHEAPPLPDWAKTAVASERAPAPLTPSRLGEPQRGGEAFEQPPLSPLTQAEGARFSRGRLVHALMQYLPEVPAEAREAHARAFVEAMGHDLPEEMRAEIVAETLAILRESSFAPLFGPGSLAEVPIAARIGDGEGAREITGQIDRLVVLDDALLVLDYKTNRPPPQTAAEVAPAYIAQLAAYRLALAALFSGRALQAALLWTDGPKLMEIPSTLLDAAEHRLWQHCNEP
jgi:ATP-dependent helicase/nuclease subunit A